MKHLTPDSVPHTNSLYSLIWKPLEDELKGVKTIYISPSGLLHKVSFAAIPCPDNKYLSDKYNLNYVSSTREVVKKNKDDRIVANGEAVFYGGINYNWNPKQNQNIKEELLTVRSPFISADTTRNSDLKYLPVTLTEVKNLSALASKYGLQTNIFTDDNATESSIKQLNGDKSPQILHLATHGYFFPEPEKNPKNLVETEGKETYVLSENPLMRTGLFLAGANRVWLGGEALEDTEDGILTAYEVSNMNLKNTKLAVLSACETGLGDIKGSEGVFGLQRAFKLAGVEYIVMSLWQVSDKPTEELMELFYNNCFKGQGIQDAFSNAQNEMKIKYSPYYWAAFVLIQ